MLLRKIWRMGRNNPSYHQKRGLAIEICGTAALYEIKERNRRTDNKKDGVWLDESFIFSIALMESDKWQGASLKDRGGVQETRRSPAGPLIIASKSRARTFVYNILSVLDVYRNGKRTKLLEFVLWELSTVRPLYRHISRKHMRIISIGSARKDVFCMGCKYNLAI